MPLIIENYEFPHQKIAQKFYPNTTFKLLSEVVSEENSEINGYIRAEASDVKKFSYYFSKIFFYEKGKVVFIDKVAQRIRYYDADTMKLVKLTETTKTKELQAVDKKEFLPHLHAQEGEIVIFPDEDSDE